MKWNIFVHELLNISIKLQADCPLILLRKERCGSAPHTCSGDFSSMFWCFSFISLSQILMENSEGRKKNLEEVLKSFNNIVKLKYHIIFTVARVQRGAEVKIRRYATQGLHVNGLRKAKSQYNLRRPFREKTQPTLDTSTTSFKNFGTLWNKNKDRMQRFAILTNLYFIHNKKK